MQEQSFEKIEKGQRGGKREGSGRKAQIEKLLESKIEDLKDIARTEFWAEIAKDAAVPRLKKILNESKDDRSAVSAAQEILNRALGKPKESVEHSGNVTIKEVIYGKGSDNPTSV